MPVLGEGLAEGLMVRTRTRPEVRGHGEVCGPAGLAATRGEIGGREVARLETGHSKYVARSETGHSEARLETGHDEH